MGVKFFNQLLKLTRNNQKSCIQYIIRIHQSQVTHGKIAAALLKIEMDTNSYKKFTGFS